MGIWLIDADVLAGGRFRVSALAETIAAIRVLTGERPNRPGQLVRPAQSRAAFQNRLAADPAGRAFVRAALLPTWLADFLCAPPLDDEPAFDDELRRIRTTPAAALRADLADDDPVLDVPDLPDRIADLLDWVWTEAIEPDWPRRVRAFEADVIARTRRLSGSGWASALDDLRPGMRWLGEGRLRINAYDYPPRDLTQGELLFIPVTGARGWVGWRRPNRYSIVYPCAGALAEGRRTAPGALGRLIGPARATLLSLLDDPMSTTQLVAVTGFALGSVGDHLKVLLDAQLVRRRRAGRSVLYYRTADGDRLARAATGGEPQPRPRP
ncbi:ArsR/SmtB family transcription factor [Jiangella endophytica]|uniref:ArsR/SmtB family transcription factor n=1 Tax=Jiangella endophytica TaxID=1623398 RepID=UPI000E343094|nr:helix-turn-helix domain-containing protein [Jiangella endophytica]